jgi:hypothetical protein
MFELPYPNLLSKTDGERIDELVRYLIQLRETLEFTLENIGIDNMSPELREKIIGVSGVSREQLSEMIAEAVANINSKEGL